MTKITRVKLGDTIVIGPDVVLIVTRADSDNRLTLAIDAPSSWVVERTRKDGSVPGPQADSAPDQIELNDPITCRGVATLS